MSDFKMNEEEMVKIELDCIIKSEGENKSKRLKR